MATLQTQGFTLDNSGKRVVVAANELDEEPLETGQDLRTAHVPRVHDQVGKALAECDSALEGAK